MTQETKPEQASVRYEQPALAGKVEQTESNSHAEEWIELTEAELQAVSGGGGLAGGVLPSNSK